MATRRTKGPLERAAYAELKKAGRLRSTLATSALAIARALDTAGRSELVEVTCPECHHHHQVDHDLPTPAPRDHVALARELRMTVRAALGDDHDDRPEPDLDDLDQAE